MLQKIIVGNENDITKTLCALIEKVSNTSIAEKQSFYVGLSGGSLVKYLCNGLPKINTDFSKWKLFFCDERVVPTDSPDSTFGIYKRELLTKLPIDDSQFVTIKQGVTAEEAALDYIQKLKETFPTELFPCFDLLLLGMGPDGHTCSLFPDHSVSNESNVWVAPITDSPKPPAERITFTLPVLNHSKCCIFSVAGESKADMVKRIFVDGANVPAAKVKPVKLCWIFDKHAAKYIST